MSGKNAYLEKQRKVQQGFLDTGEEMGIQKICDYLHIALRDPEVMGKDVFGRKRLEKLFKKLNELANYYHTAFTDDKEADLVQRDMDASLREIWGDDLNTFYERYPELKQLGYTKSRKNWRD